MNNETLHLLTEKYGKTSFTEEELEVFDTPYLRALYRCSRWHCDKNIRKFRDDMIAKTIKAFKDRNPSKASYFLPQKATHVSKYMHPMSTGSDLFIQNLSPLVEYVDGGALSQEEKGWFDIVNTSTYIGVAVMMSLRFHIIETAEETLFICHTHDEPTPLLLDIMQQNPPRSLVELYKELPKKKLETFLGAQILCLIADFVKTTVRCRSSNSAPFVSDTMNAQVFFPLDMIMSRYHLLLPLRSSQMMLAVENAKESLLDFFKEKNLPGYFWQMTFNYGGTKPQNISDNARNATRLCVQTLRPLWSTTKGFPTSGMFKFLLPKFLVEKYLQRIVLHYAERQSPTVYEDTFITLVRTFFTSALPLQRRTDVWTIENSLQLPWLHKAFLNPIRFTPALLQEHDLPLTSAEIIYRVGEDFMVWFEKQLKYEYEDYLFTMPEEAEKEQLLHLFMRVAGDYHE